MPKIERLYFNFDLPPHLKLTSLPPKAPKDIAGCPTVDRWEPNTTRWGDPSLGPLPNFIKSLGERMSEAGMRDAWMIISDTTSSEGRMAENRADQLEQLHLEDNAPTLYFLLPEYQRYVAKRVEETTGLPRPIIKASLRGLGYGDHRVTLDRVIGAITEATGHPIRFVSNDDDMVFTEFNMQWNANRLPHGLTLQPNSHILAPEPPDESLETTPGNSVVSLFEFLGLKVKELQQQYPGMRVVDSVDETRAQAFQDSLNGNPSQFSVLFPDTDMQNADNGTVIATTIANKGYRPDVHSYVVAQLALVQEFPELEVPLESYRSGPAEIFAAHSSDSNYPDAAVFGRLFNNETIYWPWMFASNVAASHDNSLKLITGHARADIDMLGMILKIISQASEHPYFYGFTDTDAMHARAKIGGNRQDIHEGTISAMVGFIAEAEVMRRLELNRSTGLWRVNRKGLVDGQKRPNIKWKADENHLKTVFNKITRLGMMATVKGKELESRKNFITNPLAVARLNQNIRRYDHIRSSIAKKLGGVNFESPLQNVGQANFTSIEYPTPSIDFSTLIPTQFELFNTLVSHETRDHVLFYADIVDAVPTIIGEVAKIIRAGEYPVAQYIRDPSSV